MGESPATAVKSKPDSSIVIGTQLVKHGEADAFVSAGNTGAVMAASLLYWGRVKGVPRPAIATVIPSLKKPVLLVDAGANAECRPEHLLEFAIVGTTYAQRILNRVDPRVGLVSIGEEESKGNELTKEAFELLKVAPINFAGNIESREVPYGGVDVAVCDGFTGNIILKTMEGTGETLFALLKESISQSMIGKVGGLLVRPALKKLARRVDFEEYGGSPLLGINGNCVICHGRSKAKAIKNAVDVASKMVSRQLLNEIKAEFSS
jgi:glycerol-3-phosphate acyltransferase PlsX